MKLPTPVLTAISFLLILVVGCGGGGGSSSTTGTTGTTGSTGTTGTSGTTGTTGTSGATGTFLAFQTTSSRAPGDIIRLNVESSGSSISGKAFIVSPSGDIVSIGTVQGQTSPKLDFQITSLNPPISWRSLSFVNGTQTGIGVVGTASFLMEAGGSVTESMTLSTDSENVQNVAGDWDILIKRSTTVVAPPNDPTQWVFQITQQGNKLSGQCRQVASQQQYSISGTVVGNFAHINFDAEWPFNDAELAFKVSSSKSFSNGLTLASNASSNYRGLQAFGEPLRPRPAGDFPSKSLIVASNSTGTVMPHFYKELRALSENGGQPTTIGHLPSGGNWNDGGIEFPIINGISTDGKWLVSTQNPSQGNGRNIVVSRPNLESNVSAFGPFNISDYDVALTDEGSRVMYKRITGQFTSDYWISTSTGQSPEILISNVSAATFRGNIAASVIAQDSWPYLQPAQVRVVESGTVVLASYSLPHSLDSSTPAYVSSPSFNPQSTKVAITYRGRASDTDPTIVNRVYLSDLASGVTLIVTSESVSAFWGRPFFNSTGDKLFFNAGSDINTPGPDIRQLSISGGPSSALAQISGVILGTTW